MKTKGFTLIELVMVIVILGILAAIALPKFVDLSGEALTASKKGMSGAVKAAQAVLVAHGHEHEVEGPRFGVGATEVMVAHQAVVDPAKMWRHPPHAFRTQEMFFDHGMG